MQLSSKGGLGLRPCLVPFSKGNSHLASKLQCIRAKEKENPRIHGRG